MHGTQMALSCANWSWSSNFYIQTLLQQPTALYTTLIAFSYSMHAPTVNNHVVPINNKHPTTWFTCESNGWDLVFDRDYMSGVTCGYKHSFVVFLLPCSQGLLSCDGSSNEVPVTSVHPADIHYKRGSVWLSSSIICQINGVLIVRILFYHRVKLHGIEVVQCLL